MWSTPRTDLCHGFPIGAVKKHLKLLISNKPVFHLGSDKVLVTKQVVGFTLCSAKHCISPFHSSVRLHVTKWKPGEIS